MTQFNKTILVFGGTGLQGGAAALALRENNWPVRALVRDPASPKARALANHGVELMAGDLSDKASIDRAMQGVYGVFSVQPSSGQGEAYGVTDAEEILYGTTIADLAQKHGVQHLVYSSVLSAGGEPLNLGHFDSKTQIERHIRAIGLPATIIRPPSFHELLLQLGGDFSGTYSFLSDADEPMHAIATRDIGRIVAGIFAAPQTCIGQSFEIAGDVITGRQVADILSKVLGRPLTYQRIGGDILDATPSLRRLSQMCDEGYFKPVVDIPAQEARFGPMIRFEDWVRTLGRPMLEEAAGSGRD